MNGYFDYTGRTDVLSGGSRTVAIRTPSGTYRVWTKRVGNNPRLKVLLLHGGPGITHEYLEAFDSYLPAAGVEYYYYDQLGCGHSDHPEDESLWDLERYVDEVEQVRAALGLDRNSFVLYGQSWGALLAIEYAVAHQAQLRGLVLSNMMSSAAAFNTYAQDVLMPQMDPEQLAEIKLFEADGDLDNPRYQQLMTEQLFVHHILRLPPEQWPDPVQRALSHGNNVIYRKMQGPSELGVSGTLAQWDRSGDLGGIHVPTLVMGAEYDTMDPDHLRAMAERLPKGRYHHCPNGSHFALYDDQATYFAGLLDFLEDLPQ